MRTATALLACAFFLLGCAGGGKGPDVPVGAFNLSGAHARGNPNASILIVEYSDFECPFCGLAAESAKSMLASHGQRVRFIYKHFPLNGNCNPALQSAGHARACAAAEAAECAGQQGRFWEYHDLLFAENIAAQKTLRAPDFSDAGLRALASSLGLDASLFDACLSSHNTLPKVRSDAAEGSRLSVQGTPTFFVNGKRAVGALSPSEWDALLRNVDGNLG
ncbi:MAG: thioredoxin domain-containing protein [Candidatus Micrarchaeia archaeon]